MTGYFISWTAHSGINQLVYCPTETALSRRIESLENNGYTYEVEVVNHE